MYFLHDILKKGCDPNKQDVEGNSSLHYAFAAYNKDIRSHGQTYQDIL